MDQPTQKRASKACDACKRRKVKCNGQERCQQCAHLGLRCIYSPSGKQRSQGKRGHIISEFRKQTANVNAISPPLLPAIAAQVNKFSAPYESALPQSAGSSGGDPSMSVTEETKLVIARVERGGLLLTGISISSITFPVTIQQTVFLGSHPGLHGRRLSCSACHS
jgi:hypothetical protein